jgi:hypothetical protein
MAESFSKFGAKLVDLQAAFPDRLAEAEVLFNTAHYGTAIALGIYALEIYLKIRICQRLDLDELPRPFQTHDLDGLLVLSGLKRRMDGLGVHPVKASWASLTGLLSKEPVDVLRYKGNTNYSRAQAEDILYNQIQHQADGVLTWLQQQA